MRITCALPALTIALTLCAALPAAASDTPPAHATTPNQTELLAMIKGNSSVGHWAGTPYKQFFNANGSTRYDEEGRRPSQGTWRVASDGKYCSVWPPSSRETCYSLVVDGRDIYWQSGDKHYKSTVVDGNIFLQ
ncbi:MAG: hypothetical protein AAF434_07440 [Pseudomonadota bacterium]